MLTSIHSLSASIGKSMSAHVVQVTLLFTFFGVGMAHAQDYWRYTIYPGYVELELQTDLPATLIKTEDNIRIPPKKNQPDETLLVEQTPSAPDTETDQVNTQIEPAESEQKVDPTIEAEEEITTVAGNVVPETALSTDVTESEPEPASIETDDVAAVEKTTVVQTIEVQTPVVSILPEPDVVSKPVEIPAQPAASQQLSTVTPEQSAQAENQNSEEIETLRVEEKIADIQNTILQWAAAWSNQQLEQYYSYYDAAFEPENGISIDEWRNQRRQRLTKPKSIIVEISDLAIAAERSTATEVVFEQRYKSDTYADKIVKSLLLVPGEAGWKIRKETTVRVL